MQKSDRANQTAPDQDDLTLVDRVLSGDRRAFESLVRKHERRVFRVSLAVLRNIEDAEEAMQDAFAATYSRLRCTDRGESCRHKPAKILPRLNGLGQRNRMFQMDFRLWGGIFCVPELRLDRFFDFVVAHEPIHTFDDPSIL